MHANKRDRMEIRKGRHANGRKQECLAAEAFAEAPRVGGEGEKGEPAG